MRRPKSSKPGRAPISCRLLYLVGQLTSGGLERQLYYLLRSLDRNRYQPAVAVWNFSETDVYVHKIRALGVPALSFGPPRLRTQQVNFFQMLGKITRT